MAPTDAPARAARPEPLAWPNLSANAAGLTLGFAAWVALGPLMPDIAATLDLTPERAALARATPILVGAALRIPCGVLSDRIGARRAFPALLAVGALGCAVGGQAASYPALLAAGLLIGAAGATFSVGVQSVSSWAHPSRQGAALGIFGVGNAGTAVTTLLAPRLAAALGWRGTLWTCGLALAAGAVGYAAIVRDAPREGAPERLATALAPLRDRRAWRIGLTYVATFGVLVAAALTIGDLLVGGYGLSPASAGVVSTVLTLSASLMRVAGGALADRLGARRVTRLALVGIAASLGAVALGPPLPALAALLLVAGTSIGLGMGSTFRLVPDTFPASVGAAGGVVGALGGLGGFVLPVAASLVAVRLGRPSFATLPLAAIALVAVAVLALERRDATGPR